MPPRSRSSPPSARGARLAVVLAVLALAVGSAGAFALGSARAHTSELLYRLGASAFAYARADHVDPARTLYLNGLALRLHSGSTRDPIPALLDAFEARCRDAGFDAARELERVAPGAPVPNGRDLERAWRPILRAERDRQGVLACLDLGMPTPGLRELVQRLQRVGETGDLAEVGAIRYVFATRERSRTTYLGISSMGPVRLPEAFPASGDAPGTDVPGLPRPPESRRVLSAWQVDAAPMLVVYASDAHAHQLIQRHRKALEAAGLEVTAGPSGAATAGSLRAEGDSVQAVIAVSATSAGGSTATILPLTAASNAE